VYFNIIFLVILKYFLQLLAKNLLSGQSAWFTLLKSLQATSI